MKEIDLLHPCSASPPFLLRINFASALDLRRVLGRGIL